MNKIKTYLFIIGCLPALKSNAQSFYIKGYGLFGFAPYNLNISESIPYGNTGGTGIVNFQNTPIGTGFTGGIGIGYFFSKNVGLELSAEYSTGTYFETVTAEHEDSGLTISDNTTGIYVIPTLIISSNNMKRFFAYGGLSPLMSVIIIKDNEQRFDSLSGNTSQSNGTSLHFAFSARAGAEYRIAGNLHLFLEFVSKAIYTPNVNPIPSADYPYKDLSGSFAVNYGLKYYFHKKQVTKT